MSDEEYREFQSVLAEPPTSGAVIPGLGGLRKIRVALPGRGKRGGARVLYILFLGAETLFRVYVFTKGDLEDIPPDKRKAIKRLVGEIKQEFAR